MLQFLRRHQRYFFFVITIVIVISFSFFGTYSTLEGPRVGDRPISTAVDGKTLKHSDVEEMALFIGSDETDKKRSGGEWGPNFLNDGVIDRDFLQTGLALPLIQAYRLPLAQEFQQRLEREKRYRFYTHPTAPFISGEMIWGYLIPQFTNSLTGLKASAEPFSDSSLEARKQLYLAQKTLPYQALNQVLRYQEKQYNWVTPDPHLDRYDLSLFGYHTVEDWYGPRFVRLVSQFILNAAKIAERKGYQVTKEEAMADLLRQTELSYEKMKNAPNLGVTNSQQYLDVQLRRMGLDESQAASIWRNVLLFRRLFQGVGNAIFVDALPFEQFNRYALQQVKGEQYQLQEALWLPNYRALQKFETYLDAIAKEKGKTPLELPKQFRSPEELLKSDPDLVQKRYLLEVAEVNAKVLQGLVSVKAMWDWQTQAENWATVQKEISELGLTSGKSVEERFAAIEALNPTTRSRLDALTRAAIVKAHPEWLESALQHAEKEQIVLELRLKGGTLPFAGVEDRKELLSLLDRAPLGEEPAGEFKQFSADGSSYYTIKVLDRTPGWEILSYGQAAKDETLETRLSSQLNAFYAKVRDGHPDLFRNSEGKFRPLSEVQDAVADLYYKDLLAAIEKEYKRHEKTGGELSRNRAAASRFYAYLSGLREQISSRPADEQQWVSRTPLEQEGKLAPAPSLAEQFKLVKRASTLSRRAQAADRAEEEIFAAPIGAWTAIVNHPNGDYWFLHIASKESANAALATTEQLNVVRRELASDAELLLMHEVLKELKEKSAIQLVAVHQEDNES